MCNVFFSLSHPIVRARISRGEKSMTQTEKKVKKTVSNTRAAEEISIVVFESSEIFRKKMFNFPSTEEN